MENPMINSGKEQRIEAAKNKEAFDVMLDILYSSFNREDSNFAFYNSLIKRDPGHIKSNVQKLASQYIKETFTNSEFNGIDALLKQKLQNDYDLIKRILNINNNGDILNMFNDIDFTRMTKEKFLNILKQTETPLNSISEPET